MIRTNQCAKPIEYSDFFVENDDDLANAMRKKNIILEWLLIHINVKKKKIESYFVRDSSLRFIFGFVLISMSEWDSISQSHLSMNFASVICFTLNRFIDTSSFPVSFSVTQLIAIKNDILFQTRVYFTCYLFPSSSSVVCVFFFFRCGFLNKRFILFINFCCCCCY